MYRRWLLVIALVVAVFIIIDAMGIVVAGVACSPGPKPPGWSSQEYQSYAASACPASW